MKEYDIAIAGGAMAGATLALALQQKSQGTIQIAVIEPFDANNQKHPGFDARSIALSIGTQQLLERFGLWSDISQVATEIKRIHVSEQGQWGLTDIDHHSYGVDALGYVVELADVGSVYHDKLSRLDGIDFYCPDSVKAITQSEQNNVIELSSGKSLACRLLVAADGAESTCCQLLNIEHSEYDFEQIAVIANITTEKPHQGQAFERFTNNGPLALLPMSGDRMSLVWCMSPSQASSLLALDEKSCIDKLQQQFGWRLGRIKQIGERASYPLILKRKESIVHHRFACVGNASQLLHPIAGQGFNLGIRDIASLVEELNVEDDVGGFISLSRFNQRRVNDRDSTIALTSGMVRLFSNQWLPLRIGRNAGLMAIDNIPLLKGPLLKRTMGLVKR